MKLIIKRLTIFQKINYYIIISLGLSVIFIFIGIGADIYNRYIGHLPFKLSNSYSLSFFFWGLYYFSNLYLFYQIHLPCTFTKCENI